MQAVRYIGKQDYRDNQFRTGLTWHHNQVRMLPDDLADRHLRHCDIFKGAKSAPKDDDTAQMLEKAAAQDKAREDQAQQSIQAMYLEIQIMDKEALDTFAHRNYQQHLDKRHTVEDLRMSVTRMIDQFGVV